MDKSGKYWGHTRTLFNINNVELHYLEIKNSGYCSEHKHDHKYNKFIILEGSITIMSWKSGNDLQPDIINLSMNDECTISPGIFHKFVNNSTEICKMLEIYWVELNPSDITRRSIGGTNDIS